MKKVIIVTGASRGLGLAVAEELVRREAHVIAVARNGPGLRIASARLQELCGEKVWTVEGDVSHAETARRTARIALEQYGRIDGLVNNAGILEPLGPVSDVNVEEWLYNMRVNLMGPLQFIQACLPALRESRGRIVNVSTGAALQPIEAWSAYCASKAGLTQLTRVVALEEPLITVLNFRPGVVDTAMQALIREKGSRKMSAERAKYFQDLKEEGKLLPPRVPGHSVAWLILHAPHSWSGEMIEVSDPRIE